MATYRTTSIVGLAQEMLLDLALLKKDRDKTLDRDKTDPVFGLEFENMKFKLWSIKRCWKLQIVVAAQPKSPKGGKRSSPTKVGSNCLDLANQVRQSYGSRSTPFQGRQMIMHTYP